MHYEWDFGFLWTYSRILWIGVGYTIGFTIITVASGLTIGALMAAARLGKAKAIVLPVTAVMEIFRCTPVLVQLIWCYYALPVVVGVELSPAIAAFITLSLYGGAFYAEIIRGGIISIDPGQWDAGRALGMRSWNLMRLIIWPQAMKRMLPPLVNQSILQLKNTSLLSVVAVPDLLYQGQLITSATYRPLETYTLIGLVYFLILFPLTRFAGLLEAKMAKRVG
jgi:polar amino acid transport system permease protein